MCGRARACMSVHVPSTRASVCVHAVCECVCFCSTPASSPFTLSTLTALCVKSEVMAEKAFSGPRWAENACCKRPRRPGECVFKGVLTNMGGCVCVRRFGLGAPALTERTEIAKILSRISFEGVQMCDRNHLMVVLKRLYGVL